MYNLSLLPLDYFSKFPRDVFLSVDSDRGRKVLPVIIEKVKVAASEIY